MKIVYDPAFWEKFKKTNVRICKSVKERLLLFSKNPNNPNLNNHVLKKEFKNYRSIDITNDWRAIYKETKMEEETVAYFIIFGTHKELYGKRTF